MSNDNNTNKKFQQNRAMWNNYNQVKAARDRWMNLFLDKKKEYDHLMDEFKKIKQYNDQMDSGDLTPESYSLVVKAVLEKIKIAE